MAAFADGRVTVTWTKPNDHGRPITSYRLRWRTDTGEFPAENVVQVLAPATEYIMIGPVPATGYQFQVLAVNSLTVDDDIDNSILGEAAAEDDVPIKWSLSSEAEVVPVVTAQLNTGDDGLTAVAAPDGKATITWRRVAQTTGTPAVTEYTVASYDLEWIALGPPEGETELPAELIDLPDAEDGWDDATPENIAAQSLMQRIIGPLPGNTNLFVRVRVVSTAGTKSAWTQAEVETIVARAPDHPELTATIIGQNIVLSWNEPESNGLRIDRYEIQFKKNDGDFGDVGDSETPDDDVIVNPRRDDGLTSTLGVMNELPPATSYSHEDLDGGVTYTYRIRTVTSLNVVDYGESIAATLATALAGRTWSAEVVATSDAGPPADPVVPGTPVLSADANDDDNVIKLSWTKPSEGSSPIVSYQIQRWDGSDWEALRTSLGPEDDKYDDTTAELGKMYYYAIRAVSLAGMGQWTQHLFPDAILLAEAPDKPVLTATVDKQSVVLYWTVPVANGAVITGYQIQVSDDGPTETERAWGEDPDTANNGTFGRADTDPLQLATTYTHSPLTPGRTLYYRMRAVNTVNADAGANEIKWSDEVSAKVAPIAPTTDPVLTTPNDGDARVVLTWTLPAPDTNPNDNTHGGTGGAVITSVEIQRWNSATRQWDDIRTHPVSLDDSEDPPIAYTIASLTHTDTGLDDGKDYTYRVRAVNEAGGSDWTMSTSTTANTAPDMPVLSAAVNGQDIVLSWTVPDDNGVPITRYEIQRFPSIADNGDEQNVWGDDVGTNGRDGETGETDTTADDDPTTDSDVIVPMPAGVTTHTDMDLKPGTTYYYRIRAVNTNNADRTADNPGWSTEVQATTDPKAPDKMTLTLARGDQKITLTWEAPKNNGSPISEYQIERWSLVSRSWQLIKDELPVSVTTYEETGLAEGTRYFYRIRAVNAGGEGAWSTLTSAVTEEADE